MTSRERFLAALRCETPDRIPYAELGVDRGFARKLLDWDDESDEEVDRESQPFSIDESRQVADAIRSDNLTYVLRAPVYAEKISGKDGRVFYGDGLLKTRDDIASMTLPDPSDPGLYAKAAEFAAAKGTRAACFVTRAGVFPTMLGMGVDRFCLALYEDVEFIEALLERYFAWAIDIATNVADLGFDAYITTDDMAFNTAPYFSPEAFRSVLLPYYRRLAENITLPWIVHSDGNIAPFLDDLVDVGISGIHPLENGAVDLTAIKKRYGSRICLLGNIDLNLLGAGSPERVRAEVRRVADILGPGGGYICTSGNSIAEYCILENVLAMVDEIHEYGVYPLSGRDG